MKNLKLISILLFMVAASTAQASNDLCEKLDGLWVLTQKTAVHSQNGKKGRTGIALALNNQI